MEDLITRFVNPARIKKVSEWITSVTSSSGFILLHHTRDIDKDHVPATLREVVFRYRDWQCSDPRDRIYGLLHLAAYTAHAKHKRIRQSRVAVHRRRPRRELHGFLEPFEKCARCREDVPDSVNYARSSFDLAMLVCKYTYHWKADLVDHITTITRLLEITLDQATVNSIRERFREQLLQQVEAIPTKIVEARGGNLIAQGMSSALDAEFHLPLHRHRSGHLCVSFLPFERDAEIVLGSWRRSHKKPAAPAKHDVDIFIGQSSFLCAVAGACARTGDVLFVANKNNVRFAVVVRRDKLDRYGMVTYALLNAEMFDLIKAFHPRLTICHRTSPGVCARTKPLNMSVSYREEPLCTLGFGMLFEYQELFVLIICLGNRTLEAATEEKAREDFANVFSTFSLASFAKATERSCTIPPGTYGMLQTPARAGDVSAQRRMTTSEWLADPSYFWNVEDTRQSWANQNDKDRGLFVADHLITRQSLVTCPDYVGLRRRENFPTDYFPSDELVRKNIPLLPKWLPRQTYTQWLRLRDNSNLARSPPLPSAEANDDDASSNGFTQSPQGRPRGLLSTICATEAGPFEMPGSFAFATAQEE